MGNELSSLQPSLRLATTNSVRSSAPRTGLGGFSRCSRGSRMLVADEHRSGTAMKRNARCRPLGCRSSMGAFGQLEVTHV